MRRLIPCLVLLLGCSRAPTVSLSANPAVVKQGQCATLTWSSADAATVAIDQGIGKVDGSGTKEVCPPTTTQYTITAAGDGGSRTASTAVRVNPLFAKLMIFPEAALFEFGKAELKPEGQVKIKEYRDIAKDELSRADKVVITGYTDNVGGADFNTTLSQQRAEAVKAYLVTLGADPAKYQVNGAGEAKPIGDNSTEEGRAKNRRVEVEVLGVESPG